MLFSGVFERYPSLKVVVVEFELSWVPYLLNTMDYTYRERHEEATYRFKDSLLPSDLFHRQVLLSFQEDAPTQAVQEALPNGAPLLNMNPFLNVYHSRKTI
jgi:predicted TIM-barrel fold metal-dependent hydrolase